MTALTPLDSGRCTAVLFDLDGTLVDTAPDMVAVLQDLQRARPTLFISVPRLWLKFQQGVFAKMPPAKLDRLLGIPVVGRLVARKVLKGLGLDQVQLAGSGSAPISSHNWKYSK